MAAVHPAAVQPADKTSTPAAQDDKAAPAKTADEKAPQAAPAKTEAPKSKGYKVVGAAVVLRADDKQERYLYRGAVVPDGAFSKDSIKHAISIGLIEKTK